MSKWKLEYDGGCKSWKKGIPYSTFSRCKGPRTVKVLEDQGRERRPIWMQGSKRPPTGVEK